MGGSSGTIPCVVKSWVRWCVILTLVAIISDALRCVISGQRAQDLTHVLALIGFELVYAIL